MADSATAIIKMLKINNQNTAVILGLGFNGLGVVRALARYKIPTVAVDSDFSGSTGHTRYSRKIKYADLYDENLIDFLIEFAKKEKHKPVLFLTIDENVLMVSKYRDILEKYFHFRLPEKYSLDVLMNKKLFADFAKEKGFPIPKTFFASNTNEVIKISNETLYPCIMKPHYRGIRWERAKIHKAFKIKNVEMLIDRYSEISPLNENVIVQEWMPGPDSEIYFCLLYFDSSSSPVTYFVGKKIRQWPHECGSTSLAMSCEQDFVLEESIRLFKTLRFKGLGSVEFKRDSRDGKFKITEPTVGRTNLQSAIAVASGVNIPYLAYMEMLGTNHWTAPKQINNVKWLNEDADFYSSFYYMRNKKLSLKQWLNSLRGKKSFALFAWNDPMPFLVFLFNFSREIGHKSLLKLVRRISVKRIKALVKRKILPFIINNIDMVQRAIYINSKSWDTKLKILTYHRISDDRDCLFDEGVITSTSQEFESQIKYISRKYNIISFGQFSNYLRERKKVPPHSLILTFDDGYRDNFSKAYPILKKYNVGATIFPTTGYIGMNKLFWWDEIAYLIKKTVKKRFRISLHKSIDYTLFREGDKKSVIASLLKLAMRIPDEYRKKIIEQLRDQLDVNVEESLGRELILNWDEIREMSKNGIEFGAHTVTHPVLANVSTEGIRYEIEESKKRIESEINREVNVFSYPAGGSDCFDYRTKFFLEQAGYLYAVTNNYGENIISKLDNFGLQRIRIDRHDDIYLFNSKIILPGVIKP